MAYQGDFGITAKVSENSDSNAKLAIQDLEGKGWTVPYVIEPSAGVDRGVLAVMNEAYTVETLENGSERTVMAFKPHLAPMMSLGIGRGFYEDTGNIGKGYRRHDEVGTPLCVTVDFQTIEEDDTVTVRNRDTMNQERVAVSELAHYVLKFMRG